TLLTSACGDDFSPTDSTTTPDDAVTSAAPSSPPPIELYPTGNPQPSPPAADSSAKAPPAPTPGAPHAASDAGSLGPASLQGPGSKPMACGGAAQLCCDRAQWRSGLECVTTAPDAGMPFTCQRDGDEPATPVDAGPPAPPPVDGDGGMPGRKPPPPERDRDGGAPPPSPRPDDHCGAEGERCCKGPGGRCNDGLSCNNPNGPDLDDSVCEP